MKPAQPNSLGMPTPKSTQAAEQLFPITGLGGRDWMPKRKGRGISPFTALRWALHGRSGHKLRTLMVGGQRCTTDAWAMDFFERCTAAAAGSKTAKVRDDDYELAEAELADAGI